MAPEEARAWQANVDAECPGDDPPPPGRTHRGQGSERDGGHDRLPGDRAQPVLERRRAHLPHEKPQHGDAGGQAQQRRAETSDGRADPGEIVWTWVAYEEDAHRGKDRPVLVVGRDDTSLVGLMLSSNSERDGQRNWFGLGAGAWDRDERPS